MAASPRAKIEIGAAPMVRSGPGRARWGSLAHSLFIAVPNLAAAGLLYLYFNYVDPGVAVATLDRGRDLGVFLVVTGTLLIANNVLGRPYFGPLWSSRDRLRRGQDVAQVPIAIRLRALNAPMATALLSLSAWLIAGLFYLPYQLWVGAGWDQAIGVFFGIVVVGGPVASALAFLIAEFHWRRNVPLFFPSGRLERDGVLRVPVSVRLGVTFLLTAVLPPLLMVLADFGLERRFGGVLPADLRPVWTGLMRTQIYILGATGLLSVAMALLVARFITHPVQALRAGMARVAAGDLTAGVPVRSIDELGELNEHFNAMVGDLRQARRIRDLFGRYVSRAVARQALERGIALGGELAKATAMFVDLRGFTALTLRLPPVEVVALLSEYYAIVERVCTGEGGIITQFLGDGVVVVFGGPLQPYPDHARRAVAAAVALQRALAARNDVGGERLLAGIGICTGDMIAGNIATGERVTYTIVGDAVNQAARLQVKTRDLGKLILVTESTRAALGEGNGFALRACGAVPLKGIAAPVETYAVEV
jgi:class 3 adenylate cyclase